MTSYGAQTEDRHSLNAHPFLPKDESAGRSDGPMQEIEELAARIGDRAANLFASRQLLCSEAVFSVLNQVLKGGLSPAMALRLSSGFPEGLGGSGCTCGSLTGGVMGLGLFLGREQTGFRNQDRVLTAANQLHAFFKMHFGATCCRVLIKNHQHGSASHYAFCADKVGQTAQMAARLILNQRPQLLEKVDHACLDQRETRLKTRLKQVINTISSLHGRVGTKPSP